NPSRSCGGLDNGRLHPFNYRGGGCRGPSAPPFSAKPATIRPAHRATDSELTGSTPRLHNEGNAWPVRPLSRTTPTPYAWPPAPSVVFRWYFRLRPPSPHGVRLVRLRGALLAGD